MDNFKVITGGDLSFRPAVSRQNVEVALDCDALGTNSQMSEESRDIQARRNFFWLAINSDFHACGSAGDGFGRERRA